MGGGTGPDPVQTQAAQQNLEISKTLAGLGAKGDARADKAFNLVFPFAQQRLQGGLPFFKALTDFKGGTNARGAAVGRAALLRQLAGASNATRTQALTDFEANRARGFDDDLTNTLLANDQAKSEAARLITGQQQIANPIGAYSAAAGANNATIGSSALVRQGGGALGAIGGAVGGLASAIPL
jgi:hypothetical protein